MFATLCLFEAYYDVSYFQRSICLRSKLMIDNDSLHWSEIDCVTFLDLCSCFKGLCHHGENWTNPMRAAKPSWQSRCMVRKKYKLRRLKHPNPTPSHLVKGLPGALWARAALTAMPLAGRLNRIWLLTVSSRSLLLCPTHHQPPQDHCIQLPWVLKAHEQKRKQKNVSQPKIVLFTTFWDCYRINQASYCFPMKILPVLFWIQCLLFSGCFSEMLLDVKCLMYNLFICLPNCFLLLDFPEENQSIWIWIPELENPMLRMVLSNSSKVTLYVYRNF